MTVVAFKEWAAITLAIGAGVQSVILRKGGIGELGGDFRPNHSQFWLYPTYYHEDRASKLKPQARPWLDLAERLRPQPGFVHLRTQVTVTHVKKLGTLEAALALDASHFWTCKTIEERFFYRKPGLCCLFVEAQSQKHPHILRELPEYAGCKSWVHLPEPLYQGGHEQ